MRRLAVILTAALGALMLIGGSIAWFTRDTGEPQADAQEQAAETALERSREQARRAQRTADLEARVAGLEEEISEPESVDGAVDTPDAPAATGSGATGFDALASRLGGRVGVVYGPMNGPAVQQGPWTTGVAWSTIKVPLAVAVHREMGRTSPSMSPAITASDNDAAARLWSALGTPDAAGSKVEAVLRSGGDGNTTVQRSVVRSGFSAYGQTVWSLTDQQRFVRGLPCIDGAPPIVSLMGAVTSSQRWGLGRIGTNQRFKGGWGPTAGGGYLVRQFGIIDLPSGPVAVAMAAEAPSFNAGIASLDALATWVASHALGGGSSSCSG